MSIPFQEESLYRDWFVHARSGLRLKDGSHSLRILEAGALNRHQGPDFVHCRFELDGIIYQGSVEMHPGSADWYAHHHHLDPAFRDVLLHVVASNAPDSRDVRHRHRSGRIPTFRLPVPATDLAAAIHCPLSAVPDNPDILRALADGRLESKIHYFTTGLNERPPVQVFFAGLFHVAGYPHNTDVFDLLAARLLSVGYPSGMSAFARLALFAGSAGFLSLSRPDAYTRLLILVFEKNFARKVMPLSPAIWKMGGCRPVNHPHFRLAGLAGLLEREALDELFALLDQRQDYWRAWGLLKQYFQIPVSEYWAGHYALSRISGDRRRFFFGVSRTMELIMNLLLPLAIARARQTGSLGHEAYLRALYQSGAVPVVRYGRFTRRYDWYAPFIKKYPFQAMGQGLLALEKQYCRPAACAVCPLVFSPGQKLKTAC